MTAGCAASNAQRTDGVEPENLRAKHTAPDSVVARADIVKSAVDAIFLRTGDIVSPPSVRGSSSIRLAIEEADGH